MGDERVLVVGLLEWNWCWLPWVELCLIDGRLSCEELEQVEVGCISRPSHSGGCHYAGPVVCWASTRARVSEGRESAVLLGEVDDLMGVGEHEASYVAIA